MTTENFKEAVAEFCRDYASDYGNKVIETEFDELDSDDWRDFVANVTVHHECFPFVDPLKYYFRLQVAQYGCSEGQDLVLIVGEEYELPADTEGMMTAMWGQTLDELSRHGRRFYEITNEQVRRLLREHNFVRKLFTSDNVEEWIREQIRQLFVDEPYHALLIKYAHNNWQYIIRTNDCTYEPEDSDVVYFSHHDRLAALEGCVLKLCELLDKRS